MDDKSESSGHVVISLTSIYDKVCEGNKQTIDAMHRIELLQRDVFAMQKAQERLEQDVDTLKKARWPMPSIAILISVFSIAYMLLKDSLGKGH